jgi:hypothetical protein
MANRGFISNLPIWVRVPGIITLVLVVVIMSATLLTAAGIGSRDTTHMMDMGGASAHSSGDLVQMTEHRAGASGHGAGDMTAGMDHVGGGGVHGSTPATAVPR